MANNPDIHKMQADLSAILFRFSQLEDDNARLKRENESLFAKNHSLALAAVATSYGQTLTDEVWMKVRIAVLLLRQAVDPLSVLDSHLNQMRTALRKSLIEKGVIRG